MIEMKNHPILFRITCLITLIALCYGCLGNNKSNASAAKILPVEETAMNPVTGDTLGFDLTQSKIHWKGTKMQGAGKHEGEIELSSAYLIIQNKRIVAGRFIADMNSIGVTDIPEHESIPRKRLNNHLKSADFFNVADFPTARFELLEAIPTSNDSLKVSGNLRIKDHSRRIEFTAAYDHHIFSTRFTIDRFEWDIAYEGSILDKTLVDKQIELKINLIH